MTSLVLRIEHKGCIGMGLLKVRPKEFWNHYRLQFRQGIQVQSLLLQLVLSDRLVKMRQLWQVQVRQLLLLIKVELSKPSQRSGKPR